jgi:hypothetical protein
MAKKDYVKILFPVGRFVGGSLTKGQQVESNGVKVVNDAGEPVLSYSFGSAIPKTPGKDWKDEPWGQQMVAVATRDWPQGQYRTDKFSWKVTDGDSTIPNQNQKIPCEREGYPGNWVVYFSSRYTPNTVNATGSGPVPADAIKPGHYIQVLASSAGNDGKSPGIYLNHDAVAHSAFGPEITLATTDFSTVGFGAAPLPAGATTTPVGGLAAPSAPAPATPVPTVPHTAPLDVPPAPGPAYKLGSTPQAVASGSVAAVLAWPQWTPELLLQHGHLAHA